MRPGAILAALLLGLLACPWAFAGEADDPGRRREVESFLEDSEVPHPVAGMRLELTFYLWAADSKGSVTTPSGTTPVKAEFADVLDKLDLGGMIHVDAWRDTWGFSFDWMYIRTSDDEPIGGAPAALDNALAVTEFVLNYRAASFAVGKGVLERIEAERFLTIDALFGGRHTFVRSEVRITGGPTIEHSQDWLDPLLGARVLWHVSERWYVGLRADVGGFGAGSEFTWNVIVGTTYRPSERISVRLGYRWYDVEYKSGAGATRFVYNVLMQGPVLGLAIHF